MAGQGRWLPSASATSPCAVDATAGCASDFGRRPAPVGQVPRSGTLSGCRAHRPTQRRRRVLAAPARRLAGPGRRRAFQVPVPISCQVWLAAADEAVARTVVHVSTTGAASEGVPAGWATRGASSSSAPPRRRRCRFVHTWCVWRAPRRAPTRGLHSSRPRRLGRFLCHASRPSPPATSRRPCGPEASPARSSRRMIRSRSGRVDAPPVTKRPLALGQRSKRLVRPEGEPPGTARNLGLRPVARRDGEALLALAWPRRTPPRPDGNRPRPHPVRRGRHGHGRFAPVPSGRRRGAHGA